MAEPSHISSSGSVRMVDVSGKASTVRTARARARVVLGAAARDALRTAVLAKGDALVTAQVAGIMAAKKTAELIPLAHPLPLAHVDVALSPDDRGVDIEATARTSAQTGVELEALVAATIAALTLYDMLKAVDKGIVIENVHLVEKTGGKSDNV
jgi:cyclic pyranopterin monophosphate synthase